MWHQTELRLVSNQSEKCDYKTNLVCFESENISVCVIQFFRLFQHHENIFYILSSQLFNALDCFSFPPAKIEKIYKRFDMKWLYQHFANIQRQFLGWSMPQSILETGSYTVRIRRKFKIISVNTNYCFRYNWWVMY